MTIFELPVTEGKPVGIVDFKIDLLLSPPVIEQRIIETVDPYISTQTQTIKIEYKDALIDEGWLNIYICRFKTGKYRLHIFGKMKGTEFRTEKEIMDPGTNSLGIVNERIKYVLINSRNILRKYYLTSNLKSLEDHLMAFLIPL
ncbi:MAG: hypothetical protein ACXVNM_02595 [Bacteroidia bacterium]